MISKFVCHTITALCLLLIADKLRAQDLDPRAYARVPVNMAFLVSGFGYSQGGVLTDPTLPIQDLHAAVESPSIAGGYTFRLLRQTAQVTAALPYAWAQLTGTVGGDPQITNRSGFSDMRLRFSMLLLGAPASTLTEIAKADRRTILGTSLTVVSPTGQYLPEKLINIGTSRWSFKPELAVSQPIGKEGPLSMELKVMTANRIRVLVEQWYSQSGKYIQ